jgi:hypothetical protein
MNLCLLVARPNLKTWWLFQGIEVLKKRRDGISRARSRGCYQVWGLDKMRGKLAALSGASFLMYSS